MNEELMMLYDESELDDFGEVSFPSISSPEKGVFKVKFGEIETRRATPLDVILLKITPAGKYRSRAYYSEAYQEGKSESPVCTSSDGVKPDGGSEIQCTTCSPRSDANPHGCRYSEWGSEPVRKIGQACSEHKHIYFILAEHADQPSAIIFQMRLSSTALKNLGGYGAELRGLHKGMSMVVTRLAHNPEVTHQQVTFARLGDVQQVHLPLIAAKKQAPELLQLGSAPALPASNAVPTPALPAAPAEPVSPAPPPQADAPVAPAAPSPVPDTPPAPAALPPAPAQDSQVAAPTTPEVPDEPPPDAPKDHFGVPWTPRYHAKNQGKKADGSWKSAIGLTPEQKVEAKEYNDSFKPDPKPVAPPSAPAPPAPPAPTPEPEELKAADGMTYKILSDGGWTDEQIAAHDVYGMLLNGAATKAPPVPEVPAAPGVPETPGRSALSDSLAKWGPDAGQ